MDLRRLPPWSLAFLLLFAVARPAAVGAQPMPHPPAGAAVSPHARRLMLAALGQTAAPSALPLRRLLDPDQPRVPLLVQAWGGAEALRRAGVSAQPLSPSFAAVNLTASELLQLWQLPAVRRVDGARYLRPRLDKSLPLVGGPALHGLGLRGSGVMVAIVDTGLDFRHPDFRNSDGSSRVAFLLDATFGRGNLHPELPASGDMAVYTKADLDAVLAAEALGKKPPLPVPALDLSGHGSHVAGIVAGNGRATAKGLPAGRYVGVAPQATLCIVKATRDEQSFADQDILTGISFCLDRAASLGLPVVVNLSLGSAGGAHDGSSALEQAIDELVGNRPGRAVVAAAGNSGADDIHASGRLLDGSQTIPIKIAAGGSSGSNKGSLSLEIFFDTAAPPSASGNPGRFEIELSSPGNRVLKAGPGESNRGSFPGEGVAIIDNSDDSMTGLRGALVLLDNLDEQTPIKAGDWQLRVTGRSVRYDVWVVDSSSSVDVSLRQHLDSDGYIEIPASAHSVISVGAMRSRADWKRVDGKAVSLDRELLRVAPFSSGGPTSDGRFAPDLLAPGEFIISALSSAAQPSSPLSVFQNPDDPSLLVADDGLHGVLRGTSQAAPHVAGAIALLFELNPRWTATELRELLRTTANSVSGNLTGPSYGPRRGFGTLDLSLLLQAVRGSPATGVDPALSDLGSNYDTISPGIGQAVVTVTPRDPHGVPLGSGLRVEIASDAGSWLGATVDTGYGRYERTLVAHGPRGTVATIQARVGGIALNRSISIEFVSDRSELGTPFRIGGCSVAGPSSSRPPSGAILGLLAMALLALLLRRRAGLALGLFALTDCSAPEPATADAPPSSAQSPSSPAHSRRFPVGGDYFWQGGDSLKSPAVVIHLQSQEAEIFDGGQLVGRSSVCSGNRRHPTPIGHFTVTEKLPEHISSRYGDYVDDSGTVVQANIDNLDLPPPSGCQFRGTKMPFFLRIVGGVGLHSGPLPGYPDSHGCVRLPPFIAQRLFSATAVGMPVTVQD